MFKIDKSFIKSEYVTTYQEGQFEQCLKLTSLLVTGSRLVFQCYQIIAYSLKQYTVNYRKTKDLPHIIILTSQMYQAYAHTCEILTHISFFFFALACNFWLILYAFFGQHISELYCTVVSLFTSPLPAVLLDDCCALCCIHDFLLTCSIKRAKN